VNKNTLLAFVIILFGLMFFTSQPYQRFYYTKILKQPFPADSVEKQKKETIQTNGKNDTEITNEAVLKETSPKINSDTSRQKIDVTPIRADTIWIETDKLVVGISEIGARIISLQTKEYRLDHKKTSTRVKDSGGYVDLIPKNSLGAVGMMINNTEYDGLFFSCPDTLSGKRIFVKNGDTVITTFIAKETSGKEIKKQFVFSGTEYKIGLKISSENLENNRLMISWVAGIFESESNNTSRYQAEERTAHYFDGENVQHIKMNKAGKEDISGDYKWIGVNSKYFFVALVADSTRNADLKIIAREETKTDTTNRNKNKFKAINYSLYYQTTATANSAEFWLYVGPSRYEDLKKYDLKFQNTLFPVLGWWQPWFLKADVWFPPLAKFVLWLLLALYNLVRDYGVAIVLLTVISKIVTFPLTQSSMKSMNRMKDIQPKVNALRSKFKSNPKKMNEEMMALYKAEGVNPLNPGCLPMFLQMPVFISLYVVLGKAIELRGASTIITPWISDLSRPEVVFSFGYSIPMYGSNFAILPVIMAALTFFQNKMTIKDPNQKMMIYFMPVFMLALFNNFPSGLVLYWTLQSALGIAQQYYLDKSQKKAVVTTDSIYTPQRGKKRRPA
jgi:YidC/Oxa1 family membrane protein insertase